MSFLRRGSARVPRRLTDFMDLHRVDGRPQKVYLRNLSCWEEHQTNGGSKIVMIYEMLGSSFAVRETFEEVDALVNVEKAVNHV